MRTAPLRVARRTIIAVVALVAVIACAGPSNSDAEPTMAVTAPAPAVSPTAPSTSAPLTTAPSTTAQSAPGAAVPGLAAASSAGWNNLTRTHDPSRSPARLLIAELGVDAAVASMGTRTDGALDLAADNETVSWFADGAQPGAAGAALLAAHVDHDGRAGVFYDLRSLEVGAEISVVAADGTTQNFIVDSPPINVKKSALPAEQIFRTDGPSTLVLVTCGGRFDRVARSYEENTIVTARLAS